MKASSGTFFLLQRGRAHQGAEFDRSLSEQQDISCFNAASWIKPKGNVFAKKVSKSDLPVNS